MAFTKRAPFYTVMLASILGIAFRVWVSFPTWMHWDENYYINMAQNYATRGELTPYMWRLGDLNITAGGGSGYGILLLVEWLRLVDFSLFWGRMLMVCLGLLTAGVMYKVASLWWRSSVAGLAALIFALVSTSSFYTLILKMDAVGILAYSLVLLLHIYAVRLRNRWLHLGTGIAAVVTMEFHALGILYLMALAAYYAWCYLAETVDGRRIIYDHESVYFAIGVLLAGAIYALVHILPSPEEYFYISTHCFECDEGMLLTEFKRLIRILVLRPHELLIFLCVFVSALTRHKHEDIHYAIIVTAWLLAQAIVGPAPYLHFFNHTWPLVALGAAGFVAWGMNYRPSKWRIPVCAMVGVVLLLANLGMHLSGSHPYLISYELKHCPPENAEPESGKQAPECELVSGQATSRSDVVNYIQSTVPHETVIMAGVALFYPLRQFENFLAYQDGTAYGTELRNESMLDFWRRVEPQVVLVDEELVARDDELTQYMSERQFIHVMPGLWMAEDLYRDQVSGRVTPPRKLVHQDRLELPTYPESRI
jgi:hypothetical protein